MPVESTRRVMRKIFGTRNDRLIKMYSARAQEVNVLEDETARLTDEELRDRTQQFRDRVDAGESARQIRHEALAVAREVMDRAVGIRSIFNPEREFDASQLPDDARALYEETAAKMAALEDAPVMGGESAPGWMQVPIPNRIYEAVRELYPKSRPPFRARPFECQIVGGMVLGEGAIAEMKTGEGKTIVGPLACYVACCENLQCHVVTVNDYLVQRDRDWVFPFYQWLGLSVGAIHPFHMQHPQEKAQAYDCDVVYGTNAEFGFDYLRDNMKRSVQEQLQKRRDFCIIDEVDSILIDEARTPLIISGPAHAGAARRYDLADQLARHLVQCQKEWDAANTTVEEALLRIKGLEGDIRNSRDKAETANMRQAIKDTEAAIPGLEVERDRFTQYYELEPERKAAHLTHSGVSEAQKIAGVGSFYVGDNMDLPHLLENALRGHAIYKRDKDYVVEEDEVVIVDENTGRKMPGRQWSDGLHQAVETKEGVKVKEETQTMATITIQNFAKLYKRLAGMTGTAVTEATEFKEIYKREVVVIPTNVPVVRADRDDRIYLHEKDKWNAIADEIKRVHDIGRPILVGTTSVAKSEMLSELLRKRHGVKHDVLNAKQHEREGEIVKSAGYIGSVMIATNMAGRGTDIVMQPFTREQIVDHWQKRNLLPRNVDPSVSDDELLKLAYREIARRELGLKAKETDVADFDELRLKLMQHWAQTYGWVPEKRVAQLSLQDCYDVLDQVEDFMLHRLEIWSSVREMGGLYVIGTERHDSRRIDNQLRGRSGRQGDPGTSRFFLALEDDLMQMFMPQSMKAILARMGMKEGEALEHKMVTNSVQKAQRKVEEANYQRRKTLLEYDEVMEYQRGDFYGSRQRVLEGRDVDQMIYHYVADSVTDAVGFYLAKDFVPQQVAEWCQATLNVSVDPARVRIEDLDELKTLVRESAEREVDDTVKNTLGEYVNDFAPREEWDLQGLRGWADSMSIKMDADWLKAASAKDIETYMVDQAHADVSDRDFSGLARFMEEHYGAKELAQWARDKFGIELVPAELDAMEPEEAIAKIDGQASEAYARREVTFPAQYVMDVVSSRMAQDPQAAVQTLMKFVESRYEETWGPEELNGKATPEIFQMLVERGEEWLHGGKLKAYVDAELPKFGGDAEKIAEWLGTRFGRTVTADQLLGKVERPSVAISAAPDGAEKPASTESVESMEDRVFREARQGMRSEMGMLERTVLLQILDQAWQDHLYAMDRLRDTIGLKAYAERDPRIEFKRQGSKYYSEMLRTVRDRVTDLIMKAQLNVGGPPQRQAPAPNYYGQENQQKAIHQAAGAPGSAPVPAGAPADGSGEGGANEDAGDRRPTSRRARRAAASRARRSGGGGGSGSAPS